MRERDHGYRPEASRGRLCYFIPKVADRYSGDFLLAEALAEIGAGLVQRLPHDIECKATRIAVPGDTNARTSESWELEMTLVFIYSIAGVVA